MTVTVGMGTLSFSAERSSYRSTIVVPTRIIHRGEGAFLRCPVSTSVQFSLRDEGSTEYMCVRGKITGDNIYRCQSACPVVLNDFDLFKENKTSQSL